METLPIRMGTYLLQRCLDVFESCETAEQVNTAFKYFQLAERTGYLNTEFADFLRRGVYPANYDRTNEKLAHMGRQ